MSLKEHNCDKIPKQGVSIFTGKANVHDQRPWLLRVAREATEQDLEENHYLEEIGEDIWSISLEIVFCPYCGESLHENKPAQVSGEFVLLDSSGWSLQRK